MTSHLAAEPRPMMSSERRATMWLFGWVTGRPSLSSAWSQKIKKDEVRIWLYCTWITLHVCLLCLSISVSLFLSLYPYFSLSVSGCVCDYSNSLFIPFELFHKIHPTSLFLHSLTHALNPLSQLTSSVQHRRHGSCWNWDCIMKIK